MEEEECLELYVDLLNEKDLQEDREGEKERKQELERFRRMEEGYKAKIEQLEKRNADLEIKLQRMRLNFSSLAKTTRAEVAIKQERIEELKRTSEDLTFTKVLASYKDLRGKEMIKGGHESDIMKNEMAKFDHKRKDEEEMEICDPKKRKKEVDTSNAKKTNTSNDVETNDQDSVNITSMQNLISTSDKDEIRTSNKICTQQGGTFKAREIIDKDISEVAEKLSKTKGPSSKLYEITSRVLSNQVSKLKETKEMHIEMARKNLVVSMQQTKESSRSNKTDKIRQTLKHRETGSVKAIQSYQRYKSRSPSDTRKRSNQDEGIKQNTRHRDHESRYKCSTRPRPRSRSRDRARGGREYDRRKRRDRERRKHHGRREPSRRSTSPVNHSRVRPSSRTRGKFKSTQESREPSPKKYSANLSSRSQVTRSTENCKKYVQKRATAVQDVSSKIASTNLDEKVFHNSCINSTEGTETILSSGISIKPVNDLEEGEITSDSENETRKVCSKVNLKQLCPYSDREERNQVKLEAESKYASQNKEDQHVVSRETPKSTKIKSNMSKRDDNGTQQVNLKDLEKLSNDVKTFAAGDETKRTQEEPRKSYKIPKICKGAGKNLVKDILDNQNIEKGRTKLKLPVNCNSAITCFSRSRVVDSIFESSPSTAASTPTSLVSPASLRVFTSTSNLETLEPIQQLPLAEQGILMKPKISQHLPIAFDNEDHNSNQKFVPTIPLVSQDDLKEMTVKELESALQASKNHFAELARKETYLKKAGNMCSPAQSVPITCHGSSPITMITPLNKITLNCDKKSIEVSQTNLEKEVSCNDILEVKCAAPKLDTQNDNSTDFNSSASIANLLRSSIGSNSHPSPVSNMMASTQPIFQYRPAQASTFTRPGRSVRRTSTTSTESDIFTSPRKRISASPAGMKPSGRRTLSRQRSKELFDDDEDEHSSATEVHHKKKDYLKISFPPRNALQMRSPVSFSHRGQGLSQNDNQEASKCSRYTPARQDLVVNKEPKPSDRNEAVIDKKQKKEAEMELPVSLSHLGLDLSDDDSQEAQNTSPEVSAERMRSPVCFSRLGLDLSEDDSQEVPGDESPEIPLGQELVFKKGDKPSGESEKDKNHIKKNKEKKRKKEKIPRKNFLGVSNTSQHHTISFNFESSQI